MHLAFDISDLATGHADGITRYTYELAQRLPNLNNSYRWTYFSPAAIKARYAISAANCQTRISPWTKYWTQIRLPGDLYRYCPDVLFMPIQQLPYLRPRKMKTVAVVHDLAVHKYPQQFTYKDWALLRLFSAYVALEADQIIAISTATAQDLAQYYGREENVTVIHHGVDHTRFRPPSSEEEKQNAWQAITKKYPQIHQPYLLYVGQIQPRKNLIRLIQAFELLAGQDKDLQLVLAGGHGWLQQKIIAQVKNSSYRHRIHLLGIVPEQLLVGLYWQADVFVLSSLYEGFGMPLLEAMACGCPVVTSHVSSLPEIAGQAALFADPNDNQDIADKINQARRQRDNLIKSGFSQAQKFNWDTTARQTLATIELARGDKNIPCNAKD